MNTPETIGNTPVITERKMRYLTRLTIFLIIKITTNATTPKMINECGELNKEDSITMNPV